MTKKRTEQTAVQQWNEEKKWVNECEIGKVRIEKWKLNEKKKVGFGEEEYVVVVVGREFAFLSGLGRKVGIRNLRRRRGGGGGAEVNGVLHRAWEERRKGYVADLANKHVHKVHQELPLYKEW